MNGHEYGWKTLPMNNEPALRIGLKIRGSIFKKSWNVLNDKFYVHVFKKSWNSNLYVQVY